MPDVPTPAAPVGGAAILDLDVGDPETLALLALYLKRLHLPTDRLRVTTSRATYARWLGRPIRGSLGGAYAFVAARNEHAILINLDRIDRSQARALEVVVAEELIHMRDRLDGDLRRHAKHGYDRIAARVAILTGTTLEEIRTALRPVARRPLRYLYACPACRVSVERRVRGVWSCARCSSRFDPTYVLRLIEDRGPRREPRRQSARRRGRD